MERSTNVPTAERVLGPTIRSPSQWPGTARSSTSAGRALIITMSVSRPRRSTLRRGRRTTRPLRRHAVNSRRSAPAALNEQRFVNRLV